MPNESCVTDALNKTNKQTNKIHLNSEPFSTGNLKWQNRLNSFANFMINKGSTG